MNIFSLHHKKPFFEDILDYMLSGECIVLLLCHETENPIDKWKKLIGPMDPVEAKVIIANAFFLK
jgi:nucleoside diphosphate kinase